MKTNFKVVIFFILISCHNSHEQNVNLVENTTIETTIPETKPIDFSTQVLPLMIGKIYTWHLEEDYFDIGTLSSLNRAQLI